MLLLAEPGLVGAGREPPAWVDLAELEKTARCHLANFDPAQFVHATTTCASTSRTSARGETREPREDDPRRLAGTDGSSREPHRRPEGTPGARAPASDARARGRRRRGARVRARGGVPGHIRRRREAGRPGGGSERPGGRSDEHGGKPRRKTRGRRGGGNGSRSRSGNRSGSRRRRLAGVHPRDVPRGDSRGGASARGALRGGLFGRGGGGGVPRVVRGGGGVGGGAFRRRSLRGRLRSPRALPPRACVHRHASPASRFWR